MTSKGQVTIPVTVRYQLGIGPGDEVVFAVEDGRGVFRRASSLASRSAALGLAVAVDAHPLVRFLCVGDDRFGAALAAASAGGPRLEVPDDVVLGLLEVGALAGVPGLVECLRDVCSERGIHLEHARAVRAGIDAVAEGHDPRSAYDAARA
jgi:AbrB family looped-hinge helix DNA binding protein